MAQKAKSRTINLGRKGKIKIKRPGAFRAKAKRAGLSTRAYAQKEKNAPGVLGRQARLALVLMKMSRGGKRKKRKLR
jgi:hypothetical protein